jgi:putative Mg2+ transporter-C (MgtC) family protein
MNETFADFTSLVHIYGARIVAASIAGAIIGLEGEIYEKPAGLRTSILITLASTLFSIVSYMVGKNSTSEVTRIAAQIVTGIGFIGAGVIVHYKFHVEGITTAATIFVNSAIGVTIGFGYIFSGVGVSVVVFLILVLLRPVDNFIDTSKFIYKVRQRDLLRNERRRQASAEKLKEYESSVNTKEANELR